MAILFFLTFLLNQILFINGNLLFDDDFNHSIPLNKWIQDYSGSSGKISILKDANGKFEAIRTNVTYCPSTPCYRAELKNPEAVRGSILPSTSGEYWIGITIRIPENWQWDANSNQQITCYIFQIHGGDNMGQSPIIGIRNIGSEYTVNICGNTELTSPDSSCKYFSAGPIRPGIWEDWVIYDKFSYDDTSVSTRGRVKVWRNGQKLVDESNLLTSYNDVKPHYLKFGSYIIQWKNPPVPNTVVDWVGSDYRAIRVGGSSSSYEEVYTGITPIGQPSTLPTSQPTAFSEVIVSSTSNSFNPTYIYIIIGVGGGLLLILIFFLIKCCFCQNNENSKEFEQIPSPSSISPPSSSSPPPSSSTLKKTEMTSTATSTTNKNNTYAVVGINENPEEQI